MSAISVSSVPSTAGAPKALMLKYQKLDVLEIKDVLLCFLQVLKYLPEGKI